MDIHRCFLLLTGGIKNDFLNAFSPQKSTNQNLLSEVNLFK